MTDKAWQNFLEWFYKTHQVTKDWTPDKASVKVWEEYTRNLTLIPYARYKGSKK